MLDPATISGVTTGVNTIVSLIKALKEGGPDTTPALDEMSEQVLQLRMHVMNVQATAINLQQENSKLTDRVAQFQAELEKLADWSVEKKNYEMRLIGHTAVVYARKPDTEGSEPPHWICSLCYDKNQKSFLGFEGQSATARYTSWKCPRCNSRISVRGSQTPVTESSQNTLPPPP